MTDAAKRAEVIRVIDECLNAPTIKTRADLADAILPLIDAAVAEAVNEQVRVDDETCAKMVAEARREERERIEEVLARLFNSRPHTWSTVMLAIASPHASAPEKDS